MTIPFDPFGRLSAQLLAMTLDPSKKWNSKRSGLEESMGFWWYKRTKQAREERGKEERKKKMEKKKKGETSLFFACKFIVGAKLRYGCCRCDG